MFQAWNMILSEHDNVRAWSTIMFQAWNMIMFQAWTMFQAWVMIMFQAWNMIMSQAWYTAQSFAAHLLCFHPLFYILPWLPACTQLTKQDLFHNHLDFGMEFSSYAPNLGFGEL